MCSNNTYLCVQKIKIKHLTKFSKDMDFEPLGRVLEHYISNSWVLFWRWNPLAFCVLLLLYSFPWFFDRVQKNGRFPTLFFHFTTRTILTGSVGRETYLYTGNPARPKAQRSSGKQLFYQEVNYCMRQKRLNGLVDRNTAVHSSSFLGGRIFLQIGERENTNHF